MNLSRTPPPHDYWLPSRSSLFVGGVLAPLHSLIQIVNVESTIKKHLQNNAFDFIPPMLFKQRRYVYRYRQTDG